MEIKKEFQMANFLTIFGTEIKIKELLILDEDKKLTR